jgi:hypothetical protein
MRLEALAQQHCLSKVFSGLVRPESSVISSSTCSTHSTHTGLLVLKALKQVLPTSELLCLLFLPTMLVSQVLAGLVSSQLFPQPQPTQTSPRALSKIMSPEEGDLGERGRRGKRR